MLMCCAKQNSLHAPTERAKTQTVLQNEHILDKGTLPFREEFHINKCKTTQEKVEHDQRKISETKQQRKQAGVTSVLEGITAMITGTRLGMYYEQQMAHSIA